MQRSETFTIVLEGEEERRRLAAAIADHYSWQSHLGHGEGSPEATKLFQLFQDLSGCRSLSEYEAQKKLELEHMVAVHKVHFREEESG